MAAATATLRLSTDPSIGIRTASSAEAISFDERPVDSGPTIRADGPTQSISVKVRLASTSAQFVLIPRWAHQEMTSEKLAPIQMGKRKAEPIAPRSAFAE